MESIWTTWQMMVVGTGWVAAGVAKRNAAPMWTIVELIRIGGGRGVILGELGSIKKDGTTYLGEGLVLVWSRLTGTALPRRMRR